MVTEIPQGWPETQILSRQKKKRVRKAQKQKNNAYYYVGSLKHQWDSRKWERFKKEQMMMLVIVFGLGENAGVNYHRRLLFLPDIFLSSLQISILAIPL